MDTFKNVAGALDPDAWLVRLNEAAAKQADKIRSAGPRNFTEMLIVREAEFCPGCDGKAATCRLAAWIATSFWRRAEFCCKCFGRTAGMIPVVDKDGVKQGERPLYLDSEPYYVMASSGKSFGVARCDCKAAEVRYGSKMNVASAASGGLCAVRRWFAERAMMDTAISRWHREAETKNAPAALPVTGGSLDYNFNPIDP